jgi:tRNA(Ile)-lysidine synthase
MTQALNEIDWPAPQRLWIGFSGGLDSTVVLDAATRLPGVQVGALHVNHHLHPDSDSWAAHCAAFCCARDIEFQSHDVDVPEHGSLEAAARAARYAVFARVLARGDVLMLGHHVDDQGETVLFQLLRGSAAQPGGMAASRPLGRGLLLRPLLGLPRRTLKQYALERHLEWLDDPGNADLRHDRNYLRHVVLPRLVERWPNAVANIVRSARAQATDARLLEALLNQEVARACSGEMGETLDTAYLHAFVEPTRLLRHWLEGYGVHGTSERALQELVRQLLSQMDQPDTLPELRVADDVVVRGYAGGVYLVREVPVAAHWSDLDWLPGSDLDLPHGTLRGRRTTGAGVCQGPFRVTLRRGGERLRPRAGGPTRTVKRLLREAGIPPWRRRDYPLLYQGEVLAALPGIAIAATQQSEAGGWDLRWEPADALRQRVS